MAELRPKGITVLSILHVLGGVAGLILIPYVAQQFSKAPEVAKGFSAAGFPPAVILSFLSIIAVVIIASGVGLWIGKKWGWYIGSFYYIYSILKSSNALLWLFYFMATLPQGEINDPYRHIIKHGITIIIHLLIYIYFFQPSVKNYFQLPDVKNKSVIFKHIGVFVLFAGFVNLSARLVA